MYRSPIQALQTFLKPVYSTSLLLATVCLLSSACANIPSTRPLAPQVEIESIKAVKLSLSGQILAFRLKVNNPNSYDLPLQTLNFIAAIDGAEMAQGITTERVTLPANGQAMMDVQVKTRINKLLGQLLLTSKSIEQKIPYDVKGFVKLGNWPTRIPFNIDGTLDNPTLR